MKYSAVHNSLIVKQEDLKGFQDDIRFAMANIRKAMKVTLAPRKREVGLEPIDQIERDLLSACQRLGIDMGAEWGHTLDLSKFE